MSDYIFKESGIKRRLIKTHEDWYVGEYKISSMDSWFPWIAGSAKFLGLTQQEKEWSISK